MGRATTTISQTREKDGDVVEEDVELVVCEGCGEIMGEVDDALENIITYNPRVDIEPIKQQILSRTRELLHENDWIEQTTVYDTENKQGTTDEVSEENFMSAVTQATREVTADSESVIVTVDYFEEVCDECGLDHGIDVSHSEQNREYTFEEQISDWVPEEAIDTSVDTSVDSTTTDNEETEESDSGTRTQAMKNGVLVASMSVFSMVIMTSAPTIYLAGLWFLIYVTIATVTERAYESGELEEGI